MYKLLNALVRTATPALLALTAAAAQPTGTAPAKPRESQWVFSLLPRSMQKNPKLDFTVITEVTEAGRKLPPASRASPVYFEPFCAGYRALGDIVDGEKQMSEKEITDLLLRSLAESGYLPAKAPEHPPTLLIVYTWGSHNLLYKNDPDNPMPRPPASAIARNMLDRAALVGGQKFADQLKQLFRDADAQAQAAVAAPPDPSGLIPDQSVFGAEQQAFSNPVQLFKRQSVKNAALLDQAADDVYYVVASAYDYQSVGTTQKVLLWRTRMTVASEGVSQELSMPALVLSAAPYFGKEMAESEILTKRIMREGKVEIGEAKVIEDRN